jgi:cobalt-zinc-cadmium efflux system membrane fusion protein
VKAYGRSVMTRPGRTMVAPVLVVWCLAGCGPSDTPAADAPRDAAPESVNVVRISPDSPQMRQIRVAPVEQGAMPTDEIVAPGRVTINPNRISRVLPQVSGRVVRVLVKFGDAVQRGQLLLTLDSPDADAAVSAYAQAESTERQTKAALQKADLDLQRAKALFTFQGIAEKDLLQAQNDQATATSNYAIAQAVREQTGRKLQQLELKPNEFHQELPVRAPIAGQVLELNVAPGEYRAGISFHTDTTAPLMTVADLSTVWMSSDVPEPFIRLVHIGEAVTITLVAFPGEVLTGRVARIGDVLDAQTRTLKVHVELPNPQGRFRPDMYGTTRHSGPLRMTVVIPAAAVIQEYGRALVFFERGPGAFERRAVTTGVRTGDRVAILSGLQPADRIVVDGAVLLKGQ